MLTWASFGGEYFGDGAFIGSVCRETVDCLGRQTHQAASGYGVYGRTVSSAGALGNPFLVNTNTTGNQNNAAPVVTSSTPCTGN